MITIYTHQGKRIEIAFESELRSPVTMGEHIRAYCHIHGSDHQRSLSIKKSTGWGHCFNAACGATVLVAEWNRALANRLLHFDYQGLTSSARSVLRPPAMELRPKPRVVQPLLFPLPKTIPQWQQDELHALHSLDEQMRQELVQSPRARLYLHARGIPFSVAREIGVGYLPPALLCKAEKREQRGVLRRWVDRMIFPLNSSDGVGYIGRSLWHWQPGMNEIDHKRLLEREAGPKRWIKTNPAGWFGADVEQLPPTIMLVEGAFDRLTLLAAGLPATDITALVGTTVQVDWLPAQVKTVVLALDEDEGGKEASIRLASQLALADIQVQFCSPSPDTWGKDWNERWRHLGHQSIAPVFEAFSRAREA
jgi:hypothetical protein